MITCRARSVNRSNMASVSHVGARAPRLWDSSDDLVAYRQTVGAEGDKDTRRQVSLRTRLAERNAWRPAFLLAHQSQRDVLGADVVVAQCDGLVQGRPERLFRAGRERDCAAWRDVTASDRALDLRLYLLCGDAERTEHPSPQPLFLPQNADQDVFRAEVVVPQRARLVLREDDHLAGSLCEALEHASSLPPRTSAWEGGPERGLTPSRFT